uniref:Uncharacterized protein n=1 Tax=Strigamia maritima TaxID=126957 RepID=T1JNF9_STRMM
MSNILSQDSASVVESQKVSAERHAQKLLDEYNIPILRTFSNLAVVRLKWGEMQCMQCDIGRNGKKFLLQCF